MLKRKLVRVVKLTRRRKQPAINVTIRLPAAVLLDLQLTETSQGIDYQDLSTESGIPITSSSTEKEPAQTVPKQEPVPSILPEVSSSLPGSDPTPNTIKPEPEPEPELLPGYRRVPPNIYPILGNELKMLNPDMEELGIDRVIFSLLDPLSKTRIDLPVKSHNCVHFECFDYASFCMFNKIPQGVQFLLRRAMTKLALEFLRFQKAAGYMYSPLKIIDFSKNGTSKKPTGKEYRCPICDTKFPLLELTVSICFNYFIKGTPKNVERIELVDMNQYRTISDRDTIDKRSQSEEVILLSDEEDDSNTEAEAEAEAKAKSNSTDVAAREMEVQLHHSTDEMAHEIEAIIQGAYDDDDEEITPSTGSTFLHQQHQQHQHQQQHHQQQHHHLIPKISLDDSEGDDEPMAERAPVSLNMAFEVLTPYLVRLKDDLVHYGNGSSSSGDQYQGSGSHDDPVTID